MNHHRQVELGLIVGGEALEPFFRQVAFEVEVLITHNGLGRRRHDRNEYGAIIDHAPQFLVEIHAGSQDVAIEKHRTTNGAQRFLDALSRVFVFARVADENATLAWARL